MPTHPVPEIHPSPSSLPWASPPPTGDLAPHQPRARRPSPPTPPRRARPLLLPSPFLPNLAPDRDLKGGAHGAPGRSVPPGSRRRQGRRCRGLGGEAASAWFCAEVGVGTLGRRDRPPPLPLRPWRSPRTGRGRLVLPELKVPFNATGGLRLGGGEDGGSRPAMEEMICIILCCWLGPRWRPERRCPRPQIASLSVSEGAASAWFRAKVGHGGGTLGRRDRPPPPSASMALTADGEGEVQVQPELKVSFNVTVGRRLGSWSPFTCGG